MATQKRYPNTAARRKTISGIGAANRLARRIELVADDFSASGASVTFNFPMPIVVKGVPLISNGSITVNSARALSPTSALVVFNSAVVESIGLTVPFEDPAIRNNTGGYMRAGALTFPD